MNPVLIQIFLFLTSLSLLIVLHELGHFIPAKLFKTRVEKFFLFFDIKFALFQKKIGETTYGIGWLPLGGYVKISGMIDESMDTDQMQSEPQPWEFRSKPAWQRLIIMLGGVTVNFVLAILIYICLAWAYGDQYIPNESLKDGVWVVDDTLGEKAGLQTGDKILAVDGNPIESFNTIILELINGNKVTLERDGRVFEQELPVDFISSLLDNEDKIQFLYPRMPFLIGDVPEESHNLSAGFKAEDRILAINDTPIVYFDEAGDILEGYKNQIVSVRIEREGTESTLSARINENGKLGLVPAFVDFNMMEEYGVLAINTQNYNFFQAIPAGITKGTDVLGSYVKQLGKIFNPRTGAYKGVGGFAAIGKMFPDTWNWERFWSTTALISMILAFMNILPIPALDGGHVVFLLYEMVSGRKPSDKFMEYAQMVGIVLLLGLLVFANGNDIYKGLFK